ncbi:uncharacterized protein LOC105704218 isoform X2 [Orussus abietinus]|uniref:uncharacterized protein LOC105704218 isoform X2 n=1 Tax=Orussus abietinus TaxID=222816 RepID=UPI000625523D|nr:uncharacterized protein LOC105704218 isoform X2 [Orussus abietinus]
MIYFPAFFLILSWFGSRLQGSNINNTLTSWTGGPRAKLEVWPQIVNGDGQKLMLRRKNEPLNMTCTAVYQSGEKNNELLSDYIVDWKVPFHVNNRGTKMERGQGPNVAWLWFERLAEKDAGDYRCMAVSVNSQKQQTLSLNIHLTVKHKIMYCDPRWFKCHSSICIMPRFMCDGKRDCEDGEDESMAAGCGPDPCVGKIYCDERCIPPDWCCDQHNCSANSQLARPEPPTIHPRFGDMSFLQTTMFTIIGCAMAFMFIVTILMIAICRVQMKRAMNSRCSQPMNMTYSRPHHATPLYDLDVYLNRTMDINNPGGVNVMYNINSGVQFVGQPVEPPPYSEVVFVPPREGPPPPYMSYDNLLELPTVQGVSPVTGSNIPLHDNLEALALNHAVNNEGVELTDTGLSWTSGAVIALWRPEVDR